MTKDELLEALIEINILGRDEEKDHFRADELLLKYIDDERITKAFNDIEKWYS